MLDNSKFVFLISQKHLGGVQAVITEISLLKYDLCQAFNNNIDVFILISNVSLLDDEIILKVDIQL